MQLWSKGCLNLHFLLQGFVNYCYMRFCCSFFSLKTSFNAPDKTGMIAFMWFLCNNWSECHVAVSAGVTNLGFWKVTQQPVLVGQDGDGTWWILYVTITGAVSFQWGMHFTLKGPSHSEEWEYILNICILHPGHCWEVGEEDYFYFLRNKGAIQL